MKMAHSGDFLRRVRTGINDASFVSPVRSCSSCSSCAVMCLALAGSLLIRASQIAAQTKPIAPNT
jgi:hypothetical protein